MLPSAGSNKDHPDLIFFPPFRTPCGFCFVEFYTHAEALASMRYISGTKLDERIIRCDLDLGYREGRQFGRGKSGGQVCTSNSCFCVTRAQNDATNLRCETSTDKTMTLDEEDGVPRHRDWKSKGGARLKNAMQMRSTLVQWQLAVKSGSMHSHHPRKQLISVLGHPTTKMTVLDSALELMRIPDGCSFLLYFCILS